MVKRSGPPHIIFKTIALKDMVVNTEGRTVEGYAATFGDVDTYHDVIHPGAFAKTLQERGAKVRFLWQHSEPIGPPLEMREDNKGLWVKAYISKTQRGDDAVTLLADKAIEGLSIGYEPVVFDYSKGSEEEDPVRNLREVKLWEFSLVTFPANEQAAVTALKEQAAANDDGAEQDKDHTEADLSPSLDDMLAKMRGALLEHDTFSAQLAAAKATLDTWLNTYSNLGATDDKAILDAEGNTGDDEDIADDDAEPGESPLTEQAAKAHSISIALALNDLAMLETAGLEQE